MPTDSDRFPSVYLFRFFQETHSQISRSRPDFHHDVSGTNGSLEDIGDGLCSRHC